MPLDYDPELGVFVDDDGSVLDEDGNLLGTVDEFYDLSGLEDGDDIEVSPEDVELYNLAREAAANEYRQQYADLRHEIQDLREQRASQIGYQVAQEELAQAEAQQEQAAADMQNAVSRLAHKLRRPITLEQAYEVAARLPESDQYDDADVQEAASRAGIGSFTEPGARGREARSDYIRSRMSELELTGGGDFEDTGGMAGQLMQDNEDRRARLAQSTSL